MKNYASALLLAACIGQALAAPTPAQVKASFRSSESELLDRDGVAIESLRMDMTVRRLPWVALADISPAVGMAVIQAEDQHFTTHGGVDLAAIGQAAWDNLFRARSRGASTITMQLAGLLNPALRGGAGGRTWGQKWDQAQAARELEKTWTKSQIMEAYLNMVPVRGEMQGIGAAARGLFGKSPSGLNQAESVILASLLRGTAAAPRVVARRACSLATELKWATGCGAIEWQVATALARPAAMAALTPAPQVAQRLLKDASKSVRSTLDGQLQRFAQDAVRRHLAALGERNVGDGALVVIDNASGNIVAYVANRGESSVDGVLARRQAGSTLKPFLYQLALERRLLTAASMLDDTPLDVATDVGAYVPQNYDRQFRGEASTRVSLASSLNVPAVRTLLLAGQDRFFNLLLALGFSTLDQPAEYYGASLALGSAEVTLLDLANAYRTLANGGMRGTPTLTPRTTEQRRRVLDPGASFIIGDILSDRAARSVTFGLKNELATGYWSAVKTGTSKDMRDNWCVGYTEKYTVGVWVGNFSGQPMWDVSGVVGAAPIWRDVIDHLHRVLPGRAPVAPATVVKVAVRYQPAVEAARSEWFVRGTESALVTVVPSTERVPRILYPGEAAILAVDPDIPDRLERVVFRAQAARGLSWRLDGQVLGPASEEFPWQPLSGAHELALVDGAGAIIARSHFQVRGR